MDSGSGGGAEAGHDPRAGVAVDLRQINRAMIEQEIRDIPDVNMPRSAASYAADLFEEGIYKEAITEYDYLTLISDFIEMVRHQPGYLKGVKPPELEENAPPEQQKGKEAMGPAANLLQRHYEVTEFLMRLATLYTQLLDLSSKTLKYSPDRQIIMHPRTVMLQRGWACANLWRALMKLKAEIKRKEYQDGAESSEMNPEEVPDHQLQQYLPAREAEAEAEAVAAIVESALSFMTDQQQQ